MLKYYTPATASQLATGQVPCLIPNEWNDGPLPENILWLDLIQPSLEERTLVESALALYLPTPSEMQDIEVSSRLYHDDGAAFMTITALIQQDTPNPINTSVTFILKHHTLVTLRYQEVRPFGTTANRLQKPGAIACSTGEDIMLGLIESLGDRMADTLEQAGTTLDRMSSEVFRTGTESPSSDDLKNILQRIGQTGDLLSRLRESLVSITRLLTFYTADHLQAEGGRPTPSQRETQIHAKTLARDVLALTDQTAFLSAKINFLLDATLGLINLEQNQIIKIFSVAAVAFLPPTLIASIYGMNFKHMPELDWHLGYIFAIGLMILSAILPFAYFKRRGWL